MSWELMAQGRVNHQGAFLDVATFRDPAQPTIRYLFTNVIDHDIPCCWFAIIDVEREEIGYHGAAADLAMRLEFRDPQRGMVIYGGGHSGQDGQLPIPHMAQLTPQEWQQLLHDPTSYIAEFIL